MKGFTLVRVNRIDENERNDGYNGDGMNCADNDECTNETDNRDLKGCLRKPQGFIRLYL